MNYYEYLGIESNASPAEIRKAYHQKALTLHPDKGGKPEEFDPIQRAYEVLFDAEHRKEYDWSLNEKPSLTRYSQYARYSKYFPPEGFEVHYTSEVKEEDCGESFYFVLSFKLNGKEIPDNNQLLQQFFCESTSLTAEQLNTFSYKQAELFRFIGDPLTVITSFMGLPNRLLDNAAQQSFLNILKNLLGWQQQVSFFRKILQCLFMPAVLVLNLLSMLINLPLNCLKMLTVFLPKQLSLLCQRKASEAEAKGRNGVKIGWKFLDLIAKNLIHDSAYSVLYPITSVRPAYSLSKVRTIKTQYKYDGLSFRREKNESVNTNPVKKRLFLLYQSYATQLGLYFLLLIPIVPLLATPLGIGIFFGAWITLPFINTFFGPWIFDKINLFKNKWYSTSEQNFANKNHDVTHHGKNTLAICSALGMEEKISNDTLVYDKPGELSLANPVQLSIQPSFGRREESPRPPNRSVSFKSL